MRREGGEGFWPFPVVCWGQEEDVTNTGRETLTLNAGALCSSLRRPNPAPHSLIPCRLRASDERELQRIAVVQPQRGPEMVVTHDLHLRGRIFGLITLEHDPAVAPGNEYPTPADAGTVGCMIPPDIPAQISLCQVPG